MPEKLFRSHCPAHRRRRLGHRPRAAEDVGEGQLGRRDRVARGRVHHDDAALGGGLDIDVVHADAGPADDLEQAGRRQRTAAVIFVSLRTAIACTSPTSVRSFSGLEP
jgi:hypothetical protein